MGDDAAAAQFHPLKAGLEDVVVSPSDICFIDGRKGRLLYRGPDVDDLVAHSTFEEVIAERGRVMGFGHRVYPVGDPRAKPLRRRASELGEEAGNPSYVKILDIVADVMPADKHMFPNVDLYSGAAYANMGIATDRFTPIFALSRVSGWAAHVPEQHGNNRLIRPRSEYTGPTDARYVPLADR